MKLYRIKDFAHKHIWTNERNICNYIHKSKENGLLESGGFMRDGRSVYIIEDKFIEWVLNCTTNLKKMYLHNLSKHNKE